MIRFFKRYSGFMRCVIEEKMAYPTGFILGHFTDFISILVTLFLWRVLFQGQSTIQGYDWNQMVIYALIVAFLNASLNLHTEMRISEKIIDGSIVSDLTKPIDYQNMCLFQTVGESLIEGGICMVTVSVTALLLTDIQQYLTFDHIIPFFISFLFAFFLKFCLAYIGGMMCFYTSNGFGVAYIRQVITDIFSGAMLPLTFFPGWFQKLAGVLPFQASVYLPTQIFLDRVDGPQMVKILVLQFVWCIVLWFLAKCLFSLAVKKITIHGG